MTTQDDLAVIDAYMRDAATRAVADAIRAQAGQLELPTGEQALYRPESLSADRRVLTVHPVDYDPPVRQLAWYRRRSTLFAAGVAAFLAVAGLVVWAVVGVVSAVSSSIDANSGSIEGFAVLAVIVLLCLMFGGRGGGSRGGSFSGTFEGRMR